LIYYWERSKKADHLRIGAIAMQDNPYDKACRYLAKLDPVAVLAFLLGLDDADFEFIRWLDTRRIAFPGQPDKTCDTVAHVDDLAANRFPWAVVIEFMLDPEALMFGRLLSYLGQVWLEEKPSTERGDRFALGGVIVNLRGKGEASRNYSWPKATLNTSLLLKECNLSTCSAAETMEQIAQRKQGRVILPWIPLMHGGGESGIIERWKEIASAEPNSQRRADYGGLVLVFADAANCWEAWKLALKEWNMIESRQVKEWQEQALRKGRIDDVLGILREKFGNLPADLPSHLETIDDANVVRQLLFKAATVASLDDFKRMLPNGSK
jgi:hypothetical protein